MTLPPGLGAGLCRYNAVTGEWLEDDVLIKMASQVSWPLGSQGTRLSGDFLQPTSVPAPSSPLPRHFDFLNLGNSVCYSVRIVPFQLC